MGHPSSDGHGGSEIRRVWESNQPVLLFTLRTLSDSELRDELEEKKESIRVRMGWILRSAASGNRTQLSSVTGWHTTDILTRLGPTFGL